MTDDQDHIAGLGPSRVYDYVSCSRGEGPIEFKYDQDISGYPGIVFGIFLAYSRSKFFWGHFVHVAKA